MTCNFLNYCEAVQHLCCKNNALTELTIGSSKCETSCLGLKSGGREARHFWKCSAIFAAKGWCEEWEDSVKIGKNGLHYSLFII